MGEIKPQWYNPGDKKIENYSQEVQNTHKKKLINQLINDWNFVEAYLTQGKDDNTSLSNLPL